jgi:hypothetical protein
MLSHRASDRHARYTLRRQIRNEEITNVTKLLLAPTLIIISAFTAIAQQPKPRVHTQYRPDDNLTMFAANTLYVANSPAQFVQLQLRGYTWGKRPVFPADSVLLEFYSFSSTPLFRKIESRVIEVITEEETTKLSRLEYQTPSSETARTSLPKSSQLNGKIVLEVLIARVPPEFVQGLIDANRVEFQLGETKFVLNDDHKGILREFGGYALPPDDVAPQPGDGISFIQPVLPKDLENAPLASVLKFLRDGLQQAALVKARFGRVNRFDPGEFSTCKIRYRLMRMDGPVPDFGLETRLDLAGVNPDLVKAVAFNDRAYLYFRTKIGYRFQSIELSSAKHAAELTAALKKAVTLCQP